MYITGLPRSLSNGRVSPWKCKIEIIGRKKKEKKKRIFARFLLPKFYSTASSRGIANCDVPPMVVVRNKKLKYDSKKIREGKKKRKRNIMVHFFFPATLYTNRTNRNRLDVRTSNYEMYIVQCTNSLFVGTYMSFRNASFTHSTRHMAQKTLTKATSGI